MNHPVMIDLVYGLTSPLNVSPGMLIDLVIAHLFEAMMAI
jgi:hypothetical protein